MKFRIDWKDANSIMNVAKIFTDNSGNRPSFSLIQCTVEDKVCTAVMVNGLASTEMKVPIIDGDDGQMFIQITEPFKKFKKTDIFVEIEETPKELLYKTITGTRSLRKLSCEHISFDRFTPSKIVKSDSEKDRIWFSARLLTDCLNTFRTEDKILIKTHGALNAILIESANRTAAVLPCRGKE